MKFRDLKSKVFISWIITLYITFHLFVFGVIDYARTVRMLINEGPLVWCLLVIGIFFLSSVIANLAQIFVKKYSILIKYAVIMLLVLLFAVPLGSQAIDTMTHFKEGIGRLTPEQYTVSKWIEINIPHNSIVLLEGYVNQFKKRKFMLAFAQSHVGPITVIEKIRTWTNTTKDIEYVVFDYSDLLRLAQYSEFKQKLIETQEFEKLFYNQTKIYNQNNIKIYKVDDPIFIYHYKGYDPQTAKKLE